MRQDISSTPIVRYGIDRIDSFMELNRLEVIIRSHEPVQDGIEKFGDSNLYTVFSCTDYGGQHKNKAAILICQKNWTQIDAKWIDCVPGGTYWFHTKKQNPQEAFPSLGDQVGHRPLTPIRQPRRR